MKPVPVDVVTGFLGSGKTTLLREVLGGALAGERVAVVVNELGDVGIDGRVITGLEGVESMIELDGGCICCTIDDYRFDMAIQELIATADPTLIVIESSGAADPGPMVERIARAGLTLDAVITVVDAANVERALAESSAARAQIVDGDFLVINKSDLVSEVEVAAVRRRLGRLNRRALQLVCERGRVGADLLFATAARRFREQALLATGLVRSTHLADEGIDSFTWSGQLPLDRRKFERFLAGLPASVYRAKGVVRFSDNPFSCVFSVTCGRYELNWIQLGDVGRAAQAVFIGRGVSGERVRIVGALERCEVRASVGAVD